MHTTLLIIQSILSVLITGAILLQAQGSGFGTTWSGGGETYHTRRGLEKVLFYFTIGAVAVFIAVALAIVVV
jgi:protein translocase SecG subunit